MAEPNSSHRSEGAEDQDSVDFEMEVSTSTAPIELTEMQQQLRNQVERIQDLEQALDQAIANLNELRLQVANQHFLEQQLASTEEIANVQQQAIHQLKRQFAEKQTSLEQQIQELQSRVQRDQALLAAVPVEAAESEAPEAHSRDRASRERLSSHFETQAHQRQVEDLQSALENQQRQFAERESQEATARSQAASLETQLTEAQRQITRLYRELSDRHTAINELEARLEGEFAPEPPLITHFPTPNAQVSDLNRSESLPLGKGEELEAQIAKQVANQALLQQACQELEADRELSQTRIAELERQAVEMQEQILSQAQQASEYEAAVQHWKDRFHQSQDKALRVKELIDALPNLAPEMVELFTTLLAPERVEPVRSLPKPEPSNPDRIDLPDFLTRRRTYRNR